MTQRVESVRVEGVAPALYQYSHALKITGGSNLLMLAGQLAVDEDGKLVGAGDFERQARQVYRNIALILQSAGGHLQDVVRYTVYLTRREDGAAFMKVRSKVFADLPGEAPIPTSTLVYVTGLVSPEFLIEIEATAVLP